MDLAAIAPRPRTVQCRCCNRRIKTAVTGRLPRYCSKACKQRAFRVTHPEWKPNRQKVSLEERVAQRVVQMLLDAKLVANTSRPMTEQE